MIKDKYLKKIPFIGKRIKELDKESRKYKLWFDNEVSFRKEFLHSYFIGKFKDSIVIYTLPKSGTTFTLHFLANYTGLLYNQITEHINFYDLAKHGFYHTLEGPSRLPGISQAKQDLMLEFENQQKNKNSTLAEFTQYDYCAHMHYFEENFGFRKCILLYRNPFDFIVSGYNWWYKKRDGSELSDEKIIKMMVDFVQIFKHQDQILQQDLQSGSNNVFRLSYEQLVQDSPGSFKKMLEFLGIPVKDEYVSKALEFSSVDNIKKLEESEQMSIVTPLKNVSFINSGKVGHWKSELSKEQVILISEIIEKNGIDINQFITE